MKYIFLTLLLLGSSQTHATYKFVIYTDEPDQSMAREVSEYFKNTPPLNQFDFSFDIKRKTRDQLGCSQTTSINDRLPECDLESIARSAMNDGFDQAMIVSDTSLGGSGGSIPVIGTKVRLDIKNKEGSITRSEIIRQNPRIMLHEYMHTLGFADEYEYNHTEAEKYCTRSQMGSYLNVAIISPKSSYRNDQDARNSHSGDIPWYGRILPTTPIATTTLGTPVNYVNQYGLFKSKTCRNASNGLTTWKPIYRDNIMDTYDGPIAPVRELLISTLESIGIQRKEVGTVNTSTTSELNDNNDNPKVIILDPKLDGDLIGGKVRQQDTSTNTDKLQTIEPKQVLIDIAPKSEEAQENSHSVVKEQEKNPVDKEDSMTNKVNVSAVEDELSSSKNIPEDNTLDNTPGSQNNCQERIQDFFNSPANREAKEEYMKIQGKISLHRIAWTYLKQASSSTRTIEDLIEELIVKRDPQLHAEFVKSGNRSRNEKLSFAIKSLKDLSQSLAIEERDQAYALQYSDVKMINLLVNAEELNGRGMKSGVMDFTSIIKNSLEERFNKKDKDLERFKTIIDSLTKQKKNFENRLLSYLKEVQCDKIYNSNTCQISNISETDLSKVLQESENLIDFVYKDDFGKQQELKSVYQWRNYWLHTSK